MVYWHYVYRVSGNKSASLRHPPYEGSLPDPHKGASKAPDTFTMVHTPQTHAAVYSTKNRSLSLLKPFRSKEFNDFLAKCLVKDPKNRPSAKDLLGVRTFPSLQHKLD